MAEILQQHDGIIGFDILVNGSKIKDTVEVQRISIQMEVNRITSATLVIQDNGAIGVASEPYANSEGNDFVPGNEIEMSLGYSDNTQKVFKGIILSQRLLVKGETSQLIIECRDKAFNLTKGRFNSLFQEQKDSDAFSTIINKYGLESDIDVTSYQNPCLVQYNCTDWEYLLLRAEANNMLVGTHLNKLSIKKIDLNVAPDYEIKASQIIIDIDLTLDSQDISDSYSMSSWDSKTQQMISSSVAIDNSLGQGNLAATKLASVLENNLKDYTSASLSESEMKACLEAEKNRAVLSKVHGTITILGTTKILAGSIIELSEFSARFNGNAFVSKVHHDLQDGEWLTKLTIGYSHKKQGVNTEVQHPGSNHLIPEIRGIHIGIVEQIEKDPTSNYRILVKVPELQGVGMESGIWARMVFPYASASAGFFFFPEIGDEVVLSFTNNDPRFPIILGSLYSEKNKPCLEPENHNPYKAIQSKSGIHITLNDEDKIVTIETPDKNTVILDDKNKTIRLEDMNANSLVMDASGISIKSTKDIKMEAPGNIHLSAQSNVDVKATADLMMEGLSISQTAQTSFTAKGNASAELSASGQTTVKGAMVMIN